MRYYAVDELCQMVAVCGAGNDVAYTPYEKAVNLFQRAMLEVEDCILELMKDTDEAYEYAVILPNLACAGVEIAFLHGKGGNDDALLEPVFFPFGVFSVNLWEKLSKLQDNPLFKLLRYFSKNVKCIRSILSMAGYDDNKPISENRMEWYDIYDVFGLYRYEHIYESVTDYIEV